MQISFLHHAFTKNIQIFMSTTPNNGSCLRGASKIMQMPRISKRKILTIQALMGCCTQFEMPPSNAAAASI